MSDSFQRLRENMVNTQIKARGVKDEKVLTAFHRVPRHMFVGSAQKFQAYEDYPLPIEHNQTISQPFIVALMTEALKLTGKEIVLEIGTGSGYQTAILAEIAKHVYTIERFEKLSYAASALLDKLGYNNISYRVGDGTKGWPEKSPFEGILVAAATADIPPALIDQMAPDSRLVIPVGDPGSQDLLVVRRDGQGNLDRESLGGCRFLPLVEEKEH